MPIFGKFGKPFTTGTGPPPTDDLTVPTRDELFLYQMYQDNPYALTAESLYIAKICGLCHHFKALEQPSLAFSIDTIALIGGRCHNTETHQYANSVFKSCQKAHVITAEGLPDTSHIDSSLVSKIAIISVPKTRELVNMLFFWEEEVTRLRLLDDEIREIEGVIRERGEGASGIEELEMALKAA